MQLAQCRLTFCPSFRSKFSETKFKTRNVYGTGYKSDEADSQGLHADRLRTFSFSSKRTQSGSEGGSTAENDGENDEKEEGVSIENEHSDDEGDTEDDSTENAPDYREVDNFMPSDHLNNNMVGVSYSKQAAFPPRSKEIISDEDDQLGLHKGE